jgi:hypothetical protein
MPASRPEVTKPAERNKMIFARRLFHIAGLYGLVVLLPQYLLEGRLGRDYPPAITHPEYFYGFIGVALAWQLVFLLIAHDPRRYRPLMPAAILEKAAFGIPVLVLFALQRLSGTMLAAGSIDLVLGTLFLVAYRQTAPGSTASA